jgi:hypothetical protein
MAIAFLFVIICSEWQKKSFWHQEQEKWSLEGQKVHLTDICSDNLDFNDFVLEIWYIGFALRLCSLSTTSYYRK